MASLQSCGIKYIFRLQLKTMERLNLRGWDEHTSVPAWRDSPKTARICA